MNKEIKEINNEIMYLRHKKNCYYRLLRVTNSLVKKIVRRQIKELTKFIQSRKVEIKRIRNESILDNLRIQIENFIM